MQAITQRQREICRFIERYRDTHGMPPSQPEIAEHFGFASATGVRDHLRALEKKGAIRREPGKARSLRVRPGVLGGERRRGIPVLGDIAAGPPTDAIEHCEIFLPVPADVFGGSPLFALVVKGDSMVDEGIRHGDLAVIESRPDVGDGEIAAVVIENEATLKTVFREPHKLVLRAANEAFPDIVVEDSDRRNVRIAGRFVGLIRSNLPLSTLSI